ncbi:MAG TPA: asparagine synthase-related protein, partial [Longimicrobiales bacterium]|nr:asparagine synthase-related protein [Longimicrobiales bacterium]
MSPPQQVEPGSLEQPAAVMPPHAVRLLFTNPDVRVVEDADAVVVTTGSGAMSADGLPIDGTMVRLRLRNSSVTDVTLARSVTTSDELYFNTTDSGGITVSDHFRNAIAVLPTDERRVSQEAVCDHFLFRTTPGYSTYVDGIQRVGQGSVVTRGRSGAVSAVVAQTLDLVETRANGLKDAADVLDSALELEVAPLRDLPDVANLLSGGIDSTLIQSYLGRGRTLSSSIDSPEFRFEESYARAASGILGTEHTVCTIAEREYLSRLEDCIVALGAPPHHLQTVLLDTAFQTGPSGYVTAQFADALFGLDAARRAAAVWPWRSVLRSFRAPPVVPARVRKAWTSRRNTARSLAQPLRDPAGFASRFAVYSEIPLAEQLFGADMVERRFARRHEYIDERIRVGSEGSELARQLEQGHWLDFFCDNTVSIWR